ncbi:hypothetical protein DKX38_016841 [Salix brachista]|uniref:Uncharacterized protein n=1 Tax=Salix brachista TaxID=2182728 RepID=A0A5N5KTM5_9ROSI|nr:hypothetical protein DKX38_016841 [Salix brachista]
MADTAGRTRLNQEEKNRLKHACDAGMVSGEVPSDSEDSNNPLSSGSVRSESPPRLADLATSFRVFSESMARMDLAEREMIKAREASRLEAEKRRMELEAELTRMMLQTQLQIASIVAGKGTSRKRKRVGEEEEGMPMSSRTLNFLFCNTSQSFPSIQGAFRRILPELRQIVAISSKQSRIEIGAATRIHSGIYSGILLASVWGYDIALEPSFNSWSFLVSSSRGGSLLVLHLYLLVLDLSVDYALIGEMHGDEISKLLPVLILIPRKTAKTSRKLLVAPRLSSNETSKDVLPVPEIHRDF